MNALVSANTDNTKLLESVEQYLGWKLSSNHARFSDLLTCCSKKLLRVNPVFNDRGDNLFIFSRAP